MMHIWVSRIDWVDYFTVLGKYIHAEKNGTDWAHEGYLAPIAESGQFRPLRLGGGEGRVDHIL